MPASEREAPRTQASSPPSTTASDSASVSPSPSGVPMSDLLASCAAANAVSTPPGDGRGPEEGAEEVRRAA
nr:hypothetical protein [Streptomyces sp. PR69]